MADIFLIVCGCGRRATRHPHLDELDLGFAPHAHETPDEDPWLRDPPLVLLSLCELGLWHGRGPGGSHGS